MKLEGRGSRVEGRESRIALRATARSSIFDLRSSILGLRFRRRFAKFAGALEETWDEFRKDDAEQQGAALAYYAIFSIFPLLILTLAAIGFALRYKGAAINAQQEILLAAERAFSPQFSETLRQTLEIIQAGAGPATGVGLITLIFAASSVFQQLKSSFRKIWRVPQEPSPGVRHYIFSLILARLFAAAMTLAVAPLLFVSLLMTTLSQRLVEALSRAPVIGGLTQHLIGYLAGLGMALALNMLIFALLFKYLPGIKIPWSDVLPGAALTALLWEILKRVLTFYIAHSRYAGAYGIVGAMLVLMLWIYFSGQMLFFGAEFTEVYSRRYGSRP
ncbi:MAG: YihY/virulence factor BrkB family protein, partial [Blastocatellia bacterium]